MIDGNQHNKSEYTIENTHIFHREGIGDDDLDEISYWRGNDHEKIQPESFFDQLMA
jgi:hypothetical protein